MTVIIYGSGSAAFATPLPVTEGGTGATASTGSGNVVLSASPTLTGTIGAAALTLTTPLPVASGGTGSATGGGKVLQVVNLVYSTKSSLTIGSVDTAITGMALSITPNGNSSRFRIDVRLFHESNADWNIVYNLLRATTRINTTSSLNNHGLSMGTQTYGSAANNDTTPEILDFSTIDSTGSTAGTAITYTLVGSSTANRTLWINRCFSSAYETGISEIIITEIGA
mgnify:FL=1